MSKTWKISALRIGNIICSASKRYPQLLPLRTSWMNFARKYQIPHPDSADIFIALLEAHELQIVSSTDFNRLLSTVERQNEEIKALEYRVKTLLRAE